MTDPSPILPLDEAAVKAEQNWLNTSAVGQGKLARIITNAYADQTKRLQRTVKTICDARRFIEAETVHHAGIPLNDWIQEKLDLLTSERAVRTAANKLMSTFPETMPDEPTKFNIPAYIVQELREAIAKVEKKEPSDV